MEEQKSIQKISRAVLEKWITQRQDKHFIIGYDTVIRGMNGGKSWQEDGYSAT